MAHNVIFFVKPQTGQQKKAPVGFSWTTLIFGFFVPMVRSDWKWAVIMFMASLASLGISGFVFPFIYNKLYIKDLISEGFLAKAVEVGRLESVEDKLKLRIPAMQAIEGNAAATLPPSGGMPQQ